MKYTGLITLVLIGIAVVLAAGGAPARGAETFTVNSTGNAQDASTGAPACDTGGFIDRDGGGGPLPPEPECTLRAAIEQANASPSPAPFPDTIAFNIPTNDPGYSPATQSFRIQTTAPSIIGDPVTIDGRTQPEFLIVGTPVVELNGLSAGAGVDGLRISAGGSGSTVRGLVINKFGFGSTAGNGIEIEGGGNNIIEGNFIGSDVTGTVSDPNGIPASGDEYGNAGSGIFINGSSNNTIGGTSGTTPGGACTGACNVLSGAGRGLYTSHGVEISGSGSTGNMIQGNIIGLDIDGIGGPARQHFENKGDGVKISGASNNTIGGGSAGAGNVITSNKANGVEIIGGPEAGTACTLGADNDGDGVVNDGCPQAGAVAESGSQCLNATNDDSPDDTLVNDGCPAVQVASGNLLEGNFIGPQASGAFIPPPPTGKSTYGVLIDGAPNNIVGTAGGTLNVVSGNLLGIQIQGSSATGNIVQRSHVGIDLAGTSGLGNIGDGIVIASGASNNTVGGTTAGARNVISGNTLHGIEIKSSTASGNLVQGNYIGTNASGTGELPNGQVGGSGTGRGVRIDSAPGNTVGGTASGARNVISGNIRFGIEIVGSSATGNTVQSNYIGTNPTATAPVGNREAGVLVNGAPNAVIGGTTSGARNVISGNGQASVMFVAPGIWITGVGATNTQVQGNLIGTDVNGTAALSNLGNGVLIIDAPANTVGGTAAGGRNIISGNGVHGVEIDAAGGTGNLVRGNYIGLNINGNAALANAGDGVLLSDAPSNTIGGTVAGAANVISANGSMGVEVLGVASSGNFVQGNLIGTDVGGTLDFGNAQHGVFINGAPTNTVGGSTTSARNVISGNGTGVFIQNGGATGNLVRGNRIGTNAAGTAALANTFDGVRIGGNASNNSVGGSAGGAGNAIAYNGANGVVIDSGTGNSILSNSIHSNGAPTGLGIDLGLDGVSNNDAGDGDSGANNLQNYPVLVSATSGSFNTRVTGSLNSAPNTMFTLQFFAVPVCDTSGFGEGATYLGSFMRLTDGAGNASFTSEALPTGGAATQSVSATATDPAGNTSEFAACVTASVSTDADEDGRPDVSDNCPLVPNFDQQNTDGDSAGNACDNCPSFSSPDQTDTDGDGQGNPCDADDDNDGVLDGADNCPVTANPDQANADSDAQGDACDPDDDNDSVLDTSDNCPFWPNVAQTDTDGDGSGDACDGGLGYYHPLSPYRILDTRTGPQGVPAGKVGNNSEITVDVTGGPSGVPTSDVSAVVLNVTVTEATQPSFLTVYPTGVPRPNASNLNFSSGQTVPNLVTVKVGIDGNVKAYNAAGLVHVIFDVVGWYGGPSGGSRFNAITPARILDTRTTPQGTPPGSVDQNETVVVDVTGVGGVPANATAVVLNVTATNPNAASFLTVHPSDTGLPNASNLNFTAGKTVPNLVIVKVGGDGNVKVYNALGSVHVIFDVVGWYGAGGDLLYPLTPARVLDTRTGPQGTPPGKVGHGATIAVDVTVGAIPATASGVIVNTTVTEPTLASFLTVFPNAPRPTASNLNFTNGQTVPNLVMVKVGTGGNVQVYNAAGQVHVIFDAVGYFAP